MESVSTSILKPRIRSSRSSLTTASMVTGPCGCSFTCAAPRQSILAKAPRFALLLPNRNSRGLEFPVFLRTALALPEWLHGPYLRTLNLNLDRRNPVRLLPLARSSRSRNHPHWLLRRHLCLLRLHLLGLRH